MFELDLVNLEELNSKTLNGRRFYDTPDGLSYPSVTTVVGILSKRTCKCIIPTHQALT